MIFSKWLKFCCFFTYNLIDLSFFNFLSRGFFNTWDIHPKLLLEKNSPNFFVDQVSTSLWVEMQSTFTINLSHMASFPRNLEFPRFLRTSFELVFPNTNYDVKIWYGRPVMQQLPKGPCKLNRCVTFCWQRLSFRWYFHSKW